MASLTSRLNNHVDIDLFVSHPLNLPIIIYSLPAILYTGMVSLVFWLLKPRVGTTHTSTTPRWIPVLCILPPLGLGALVGLSLWEEVLVAIPLSMSLFVLPWYFCLHRKRSEDDYSHKYKTSRCIQYILLILV